MTEFGLFLEFKGSFIVYKCLFLTLNRLLKIDHMISTLQDKEILDKIQYRLITRDFVFKYFLMEKKFWGRHIGT